MTKLPGPVSWMGGKGNKINKLTPYIPYTKLYVEPFGGAGSILFSRQPSPVETYNDIDGRLVNLMRVLQSPESFELFCRRLEGTLYSLEEFRLALDILHNRPDASSLDRAWALFVAQNQGFSGWVPKYEGNWGRSFTPARGMASTVSTWMGRLNRLELWHNRISRVQIDSRDALEVIRYWDSDDTTFYIDPPYVKETRKFLDEAGHSYQQEPDLEYHAALVSRILDCKGAVVLSGYDYKVYDPLIDAGWEKFSWDTSCMAAGRKRGSKIRGVGSATKHAARTETVWRNQLATALAPIEESEVV